VADLLTRRRRDIKHRSTRPAEEAIVAAAAILTPSRALRLTKYPWQNQLWNYYRDGIGAFKYGMLWHSQTMSRVRLTAAKTMPGGDEPEPLTDGPAAEAVEQFYGGSSGQSQYMASIDLQLQIPGEGYVVGEEDPDRPGEKLWCVKSNEEMNVVSGKVGRGKTADLWQVQVDEGVWRTLGPNSMVFRQWIPDPERGWRPDSPARGAMRIMQLIDMLERRIMAQTVSRLAMNGFLLYPSEVTFPINPDFKDEADPFTAELLDIAGKAIENPGSALAAMPLPLKVPKEYIESFKRLEFANAFDERLMEILRFEYDNLAVAMNMPKEVMTGMGDTSHWNAWSLDEQGIETHIKPPAEGIVQGLTKTYLKPWLKAAGAPLYDSDGGEYIFWYDTSELDVPPDLSAAANDAYDRQAIDADAYRTAKGFSEGDKPDKKELREQLLLQLAKDPTNAPAAIEELTGSPVAGASTGPGGVDDGAPASQPTPATGPRVPSQPEPPANPSEPQAAAPE
jgi:hypothetical protein